MTYINGGEAWTLDRSWEVLLLCSSSHANASSDNATALAIYDDLQHKGVNIFWIKIGGAVTQTNLLDLIQKKILVVVCVMTRALLDDLSNKDNELRQQLVAAINANRKVITVLDEESEFDLNSIPSNISTALSGAVSNDEVFSFVQNELVRLTLLDYGEADKPNEVLWFRNMEAKWRVNMGNLHTAFRKKNNLTGGYKDEAKRVENSNAGSLDVLAPLGSFDTESLESVTVCRKTTVFPSVMSDTECELVEAEIDRNVTWNPTIKGRSMTSLEWPDLSKQLWQRVQHMLPKEVRIKGHIWEVTGFGSGWRLVKSDRGASQPPHVDERIIVDINTISMGTFIVYLRCPSSGGRFVIHDIDSTVSKWSLGRGHGIFVSHDVFHEAEAANVDGSVPSSYKVILRGDIYMKRTLKPTQADVDAWALYQQSRSIRSSTGNNEEADTVERQAYETSSHLAQLRFGYKLGGPL